MSPDRERLALDMRVTARHLFEYALAEASIDRAFQRHVDCERGVLRIFEDLFYLEPYRRIVVVSIGKAAHTMVNSLEMQVGSRFEGIVAGSVEPASQVRGFRYFQGGHPTPNKESLRAADAMLKTLSTLDLSCLAIFLLSGGGSSIAEKPINDEISAIDDPPPLRRKMARHERSSVLSVFSMASAARSDSLFGVGWPPWK